MRRVPASPDTYAALAARLEAMAAAPSVPRDAVDRLALEQGAQCLREKAAGSSERSHLRAAE